MKKVIEIDEKEYARIELIMAFYNCATFEEYITSTAAIDWVAMNEMKIADLTMDNYIGHDFGFAEEK